MRVGAVSLLAAAVLACDGRAGEPAPPAAPGPAGASGPTAPVGPAPACALAPDLPPASSTTPCPALAPLGAPAALSFVRRSAGSGMACADQIAVDGEGSVAFRAVEELGGGGYWRSWLEPFAPDGSARPAQAGNAELLVPGAHGFLAFVPPAGVRWTGSAWTEWRDAAIAWPVTLPGALFWPARYVGLLALGPGLDGDLLVALAGADANGDAEVDLARVSPGPAFPMSPARAFTIPSPAPGWAADPHATALLAATGSVAIAADAAGRILLLWDGAAACGAGSIAGRWFAPDGAALGPPFLAARGRLAPDPGGHDHAARLFRLPDGGLVLRAADGAFVRRFAGGAPAGGPAPGWLAARAGEELAPLPLAGVVAAIRPPAGEAGARIEVVAGGGAVCSTAALPPPVLAASDVSPGPAAAVGVDGTLVALDRVDVANDAASCTCRYRLWRGALR